MHASSMENMRKCVSRYFLNSPLSTRSTVSILDIGGRDVNGSYADLFRGDQFDYKGVDIEEADGVSIVLEDPYKLPVPDNSVDIVLSGQMLEHCEYFWLTFSEMIRVLKDDGILFLIAPSGGPIHKYPVDCYRFYPDAYLALAKYANCYAVDVWHDNRGPWNDLVGVFSKTDYEKQTGPVIFADEMKQASQLVGLKPEKTDASEATSGVAPYLDTLRLLHERWQPTTYLEIGVWTGESLELAQCPAVGVDPSPTRKAARTPQSRLVKMGSDDFFEDKTDEILKGKLDLAFIDGMHLFEYAMRDFMHIEQYTTPQSVVIIDDVSPNHPDQANRVRTTSNWTGDVWKLHIILKRFRPDLLLVPIDTQPTGLLMVLGLDAKNKVLWEKYNPIVDTHATKHPPPDEILKREWALSPTGDDFAEIVRIVEQARQEGVPIKRYRPAIKKILAAYQS